MNSVLKILLVLLLISTSCEKEFDSIIGKYESKEYSRIELAWMGINNTFAAVGSTIEIKEDSTFNYQTCGNIMTGNWKLKNDTLYLFAAHNRWRNDSLHFNGFEGRQPNISTTPLKFVIDGQEIISESKVDEDGKAKWIINRLKIKDPDSTGRNMAPRPGN